MEDFLYVPRRLLGTWMQFQNLFAIRNETPLCKRSPIALPENKKRESSIYSCFKRHQALLYFPIFSGILGGEVGKTYQLLRVGYWSPPTAFGLGLIYGFASNSICFIKLGAPVFGMHVFRMLMALWWIVPLISLKWPSLSFLSSFDIGSCFGATHEFPNHLEELTGSGQKQRHNPSLTTRTILLPWSALGEGNGGRRLSGTVSSETNGIGML